MRRQGSTERILVALCIDCGDGLSDRGCILVMISGPFFMGICVLRRHDLTGESRV